MVHYFQMQGKSFDLQNPALEIYFFVNSIHQEIVIWNLIPLNVVELLLQVFAKYGINGYGYISFKMIITFLFLVVVFRMMVLKDKILACQSKALFGQSYYVFLSR